MSKVRFVARSTSVVVVVSAMLALVACKKKAGSSCSGNEALCADKQTILECHDGKLVAMACKGAKGCGEKATGVSRSGNTVTTNYDVTCDFSGNAPGEDCLNDGESVCSGDKTKMATCKNKKLVVDDCLGDKHCTETATAIECDDSVQKVGATCEGNDTACSPDKKQILSCKTGKMAVDSNCRGPKGCHVDGNSIGCDLGGQNIGEPCGGGYACAADGKATLKCNGGKWAHDEKCKKGCVTKGNEVGCS